MDYETRCMREWQRKLVREAISDYRVADADAAGCVTDARADAAWGRVLYQFGARHAAPRESLHGVVKVAPAAESFESRRARERADARWDGLQRHNALVAKARAAGAK